MLDLKGLDIAPGADTAAAARLIAAGTAETEIVLLPSGPHALRVRVGTGRPVRDPEPGGGRALLCGDPGGGLEMLTWKSAAAAGPGPARRAGGGRGDRAQLSRRHVGHGPATRGGAGTRPRWSDAGHRMRGAASRRWAMTSKGWRPATAWSPSARPPSPATWPSTGTGSFACRMRSRPPPLPAWPVAFFTAHLRAGPPRPAGRGLRLC